ncbi:metallophosphoesterase [Pedobacter sp. KR3-3]|uniref:Metallophosphoesterase n=1 Tax=Pedobacter albus TaxID=3113905 RepID=A0ABU7IDI9_9SPHI|nr:metallophosphoesterase [Pedobacter sp. KR3-3]MEE1947259.1 metallophosphoesterase [Pedobacter sp. KR3-3]
MRTMVMGDIHGAYKALLQCLQRSGFDYENDRLIQLGDVADGYPQVYECVEELLKIKRLIALKGNHDDWLHEFFETDFHPQFWTYGGKATLVSYLEHAGKEGNYFATGTGFKTSLVAGDIPMHHRAFFAGQVLYHVDEKNRCFVHGGFKREIPFYKQRPVDYYWDRTLWEDALQLKNSRANLKTISRFPEIYIGHTPTTDRGKDTPQQALNVTNMDTGAGHSGRLSIMDVDTREYWQSDPLPELYAPNTTI